MRIRHAVLAPHNCSLISLAPREAAVLRLILDDLSNGEIATALSITADTAAQYVHRLADALQLRRTGLMRWGFQNLELGVLAGLPVPMAPHPAHCLCSAILCKALRMATAEPIPLPNTA